MTKKIVLFIMIGFGFSFTKITGQNLESFQKKLDSLNVNFNISEGYQEVKTEENKQLHYLFAMKDLKNDFEVRYGLYPITAKDIEKHKACEADPNCYGVDPNHTYKSLMMAHVSNLTGGKSRNFQRFKDQWIQDKLGADHGVISSVFEFDCEFGKGYKYGQIMIVHKDNVADIAVVFLSNTKTGYEENRQKCFQALQFEKH